MTNMDCMNTYIFQDPGMRENDMNAVLERVNRPFQTDCIGETLKGLEDSTGLKS